MHTLFDRVPAPVRWGGLVVSLVLFLAWITSGSPAPPSGSRGIPKSGYILENLRVAPQNGFQPAAYSIECNPAVRSGMFRTGTDSFYIDDTGVLRHSGNPEKSAGPADQPIQ